MGDALGMPTQLLELDQVLSRYGIIDRFHAGAPDSAVSAGLPPGRVTDDTEQAWIVARLVRAGRGRVDPYLLAAALREWEAQAIANGSADLLGPSTRLALRRLSDGEPLDAAGRDGTTNGAAMRVAPVGVANAPEPLAALVDAVEEACRPTHGASVAIAGAAAVAAAVSVGIEGGDLADSVGLASAAARLGARRGVAVPGQLRRRAGRAGHDRSTGRDEPQDNPVRACRSCSGGAFR
jgi:ADP-ribosylglycohydrolase